MNYTLKNPADIGVYVQTSNIKTITQVQKAIDADVICNFQLFTIATREANFVLKVDGKVIGNDGSNYYGYGWNKGDKTLTFTTASQMGKFDNFAGCIYVLKDGKVRNLKAGVDYPTALGGKRGRTCIGTKADGSIVIYCWADGTSGACTMEQLGQKMLDFGCVNAVNYDGGGSTQLICPDGKVTTSRAIYNFLYFKLDEDKVEKENKVEKQEETKSNTTITTTKKPNTTPSTTTTSSTKKPASIKPVCPYAEPKYAIRHGSRGVGAKWVQWQLNRHGAKLTVDGVIGTLSVAAIKAFQKKSNLIPDGIVGGKTRTILKK